ncbi:MAG: hypothetical protein M3O70_22090 [Actinomycetota bacterium]|nr:hypothetical protein [Actinomycetota bacterium]
MVSLPEIVFSLLSLLLWVAVIGTVVYLVSRARRYSDERGEQLRSIEQKLDRLLDERE